MNGALLLDEAFRGSLSAAGCGLFLFVLGLAVLGWLVWRSVRRRRWGQHLPARRKDVRYERGRWPGDGPS